MGNHWSNQFLHALRSGDVAKASDLYQNKPQLRESLQANLSLGAEHADNTYLHYAALLGMRSMYEDLIRGHGKPDLKNAARRNCLHLICSPASASAGDMDDVKCGMLEVTLGHGLKGMDIKHLLSEKDVNGDTALHVAAGAGLGACVDLLVRHEADMVATNEEGQTPADLAKAKNHSSIATRLEANMVFSCEEDLAESVEPDSEFLEAIVDTPVAMQDTDLRSMKDTLLIEASEMLGVSLQSAEVLLKHFGWSKEELLQAWLENAQRVCEDAGVEMPGEGVPQDFLGATEPLPLEVGVAGSEDCGICCLPCDCPRVPCGHVFCRECWKQYLEGKIATGELQKILCPQYDCAELVPLEVIEGVVSREMALKFLSFDIKAFVDSNPNIRWCPYPGCSQAVNRPPPPDDRTPSSDEGSGQTVPCGNGHYFCWACLQEAHEPCSCTMWQRWLQHCIDMKVRIGDTTAAEADEAASSKWLVDYSKPCPKCKSPIQKTEGCNHMICKYCRHDFCWVCLGEWKCHNTATGGYFNCNRYDAQSSAGAFLIQRRALVLKDCKNLEEVSKFLHHHDRYKEHIKSYQLEVPFLDIAQQKMLDLALSIRSLESGGSARGASISGRSKPVDLSFIQDAVQELLKCRQVLKATYCYGYYLTGIVSTKQFEHMQGALEQVAEMLAEAVARPHLRKPRMEIIRLTREARVKRVCLVRNVHTGLPLSTHPFMDSLGGGPRGDKNGHQLKRFLQDLDTYTPRPRDQQLAREGRGHGYKVDTDEDLLRILEESRVEHETDKQMREDLELAKTLSLDNGSQATPTPVSPPSSVGETWLDELACADATPWPVLRLHSLPPASPLHSGDARAQSPHHYGDIRVQSPHHYGNARAQSPPGWNHYGDALAQSLPDWNYYDDAREQSPPPGPYSAYGDARVQSPLPGSANGDARVQSPPPGPYGDARVQSPPLGSDARVQSPPLGSDARVQSPPLGSPYGDARVQSPLGDEWGPVYGEDEDLRIAIQDSLLESNGVDNTSGHMASVEDMVGPSPDASGDNADQATGKDYKNAGRHVDNGGDVLVTGRQARPLLSSHHYGGLHTEFPNSAGRTAFLNTAGHSALPISAGHITSASVRRTTAGGHHTSSLHPNFRKRISSDSSLQFSHCPLLVSPSSPSRQPAQDENTSLTPQLQQLLDSSARLAANV